MSREALGELEHQILLAILRLGGESYSVPILLEIEACTGKQVAPAAVYIGLRRLEAKGLVKSKRAERDPESHRPRRYFKLRPVAVERLKESRRQFSRLWEGLEPLLEDR